MENKWREIRQARYADDEGRGTADDAAYGRAGASGAAATFKFLRMIVCRRRAVSLL